MLRPQQTTTHDQRRVTNERSEKMVTRGNGGGGICVPHQTLCTRRGKCGTVAGISRDGAGRGGEARRGREHATRRLCLKKTPGKAVETGGWWKVCSQSLPPRPCPGLSLASPGGPDQGDRRGRALRSGGAGGALPPRWCVTAMGGGQPWRNPMPPGPGVGLGCPPQHDACGEGEGKGREGGEDETQPAHKYTHPQ